MEYIMHKFDSIHKFVNEADRRARSTESSHSKDKGFGGEDWHGTDSFAQAVQFAKFGGWEPQGAPKFRKLFDELIPKLRKFTDLNMERFPDVVGDEVNVAAYLEGEPDHMYDWVPQETEQTKRALCLLVGHSISSGCTAEELFVRGQALVGLVRALSLLGYELEIWSEETVGGWGGQRNHDEQWSILVRLHAAGEIMDTSAIEFAIGNPSWLRRLLFGFQEGEPNDVRSHYGFGKGGYGSVRSIQHQGVVNADISLNLGERWFNERSGNDAKDGVDWVVAQLKRLEVLPQDAEIDWEEA